MQHKVRYQKGFTLIEVLIYIGLMSILVGVLGSMFATIVDVQLSSQSNSNVDQDGRYLLSKLLYDMKSSTSVVTPSSTGTQSATLQLQIPGNTLNYTYSLNSSGNLQLVNDQGTNVLNGYDTQVSNLSFQRIGNGSSTDTILVSFTLTSRVRQHSGYESRSFQTTLSRDYKL